MKRSLGIVVSLPYRRGARVGVWVNSVLVVKEYRSKRLRWQLVWCKTGLS